MSGPTNAIYDYLDGHPDERGRVTHADGRGQVCTAKVVKRLPLWEQRARGGITERVVPCCSTANWTLDGEPRCTAHTLRGLLGKDPAAR